MKTHYQVLGVSPDATQKVIESAYRKRARQLHPDKNNGADKEKNKMMFFELNTSFDVLKSKEKRAAYNREIKDFIKSRRCLRAKSSRENADVLNQERQRLEQEARQKNKFIINKIKEKILRMRQAAAACVTSPHGRRRATPVPQNLSHQQIFNRLRAMAAKAQGRLRGDPTPR